MKIIIRFLLLFSLLGGCSLSGKYIEREESSDWNISQIISEAFDEASQDGMLVAAKRKVDDRPLYVESAIIMYKSNDLWRLAHVFRHPEVDNTHRKNWKVVWRSHFFLLGFNDYKEKPSRADIEHFLSKTEWHKDLGAQWKILESTTQY
ncbi:hypothetical protein M0G74_18140 [Microbulbifer sp. CAU 1566]|uniref:hypothetical protein n=1 Tax=Microbulbifer sp. CAU 1566 TaxID=2933269 RepID=UPI002005376C|nr:hypothetical protein [Microbulbifer sp. CAU 1566]MCK7599197.1 hypothetical protein [Microbulbifer sp. CAU 1566]